MLCQRQKTNPTAITSWTRPLRVLGQGPGLKQEREEGWEDSETGPAGRESAVHKSKFLSWNPTPPPSSGPEKASSWETPKETSCSHLLSLEILSLLFNRFTSTWSLIPASNSLSAWDRVAQKALRAQGLEELGATEGNGLLRVSSRPTWQSHVLAASSDRGVLACGYQ